MTTFQTKLDVAPLLESAVWPAFLVDPGGIIKRANKPAIELFGPELQGQLSPLSAILCDPNPPEIQKFLAQFEGSPAASVATRIWIAPSRNCCSA